MDETEAKIKALRTEIGQLDREIRIKQGELQAAKWELEKLVPPVRKGDEVRVKGQGGLLYVGDVAYVFGEWHVKGTFASNRTKFYTYPVSALEI